MRNQDSPPHEGNRRGDEAASHTEAEVRELIIRLAKKNDWGYTRILGDLKKLGVKVARSTVVKVLREYGL